MNEISESLRDLIDEYVNGTIDEAALRELEAALTADVEARRYFVRYCRLHTDLDLEARARSAGARALKTLEEPEILKVPRATWLGRLKVWGSIAAAALLAFGLSVLWQLRPEPETKTQPVEEMAWLINAQNCQWTVNMAPAGDMRAGKILGLERGLAEIRFQKGARIVMEGPASLELVSDNSARLLRGKLTAKVPESAKGFQVVTPKGKVVDLGTEFAMAVEEDGTTEVFVYTGAVEAYANAKNFAAGDFLNLQENQAARIGTGGVARKPDQGKPQNTPFFRGIPIFVPRVYSLDFSCPVPDTLLDPQGFGTGLTQRLPGTGKIFKFSDSNLWLDPEKGQLALTTTKSDLNTRHRLDQGEYLGIKLTDLGFTGVEDFTLTVVLHNIPALEHVGQFGLYAGIHSDYTIRGGLLSSKEPEQYRQFLVQNMNGKDKAPHYVGLTTPGDDIRLTLRREGKVYALTVESLTTGNSTILTMPQPAYLEGQRDIYVGFFGANTQSDLRRTLTLKEFKATVWTLAQGPA